MSILGGGLLGSSRNGIGNIITYVVKGRTIARTKPATYNDAKSGTQLLQRDRLRAVMFYARLLLGVIRTSFQTKKAFLSGVNAFIQANLKPDNFGFNDNKFKLPNMVIAKGLLQKVNLFSAQLNDLTGTLTCTYDSSANDSTGFGTDFIYYAVIDGDSGLVYSGSTTELRSNGAFSINIPALMNTTSLNLACYIYAKSDPSTKMYDVSDSDYMKINY